MKLRKLLLGLRLWVRSCRARREFKRLKRELAELRIEFEDDKNSLTWHYEKQLAYERTRNETLHTEWANRFLQFQKLAPLGVSTSLIEEKAALRLPFKEEDDVEGTLTSIQAAELQDRRDKFFQDGLQLEKSPQEIANRWNDIKDDVITDIKLAIL